MGFKYSLGAPTKPVSQSKRAKSVLPVLGLDAMTYGCNLPALGGRSQSGPFRGSRSTPEPYPAVGIEKSAWAFWVLTRATCAKLCPRSSAMR